MKRVEKILLAGFVLAAVFSFLGFSANCEQISEKVLRLHVLANSDSEYDQRIKLQVKDTVADCAGQLLTGTESLDGAQALLAENLGTIQAAANEKLRALGADYRAQVRMENAYFSTRTYADFDMPAGRYRALRVFLGRGEGQNWWCVVYPSLCVSAAGDFDSFTPHQQEILQQADDYRVSFKVYEWYQALMAFLSPQA